MPGSTAFYRPYVGKKHCYLKPIYFATTFEIVEVERFEISPTRMGWMLKDRDQSCMLVNNASANTGARRGYHGWLGADKGFSTLTIADNYGFNGSLESVKERVLGKGSPEQACHTILLLTTVCQLLEPTVLRHHSLNQSLVLLKRGNCLCVGRSRLATSSEADGKLPPL